VSAPNFFYEVDDARDVRMFLEEVAEFGEALSFLLVAPGLAELASYAFTKGNTALLRERLSGGPSDAVFRVIKGSGVRVVHGQ
jgi:hypothetical protein